MRRCNRKYLSVCRAVLFTLAVLGILFALGCGGSSSSTPVQQQPPPPPANTSTQIRIGDAAVDRIVSFEVTLASPIVVTPSGGGANLNITVANNRLELSHMSANFEPLGILNLPQGSFSSAAITVTNPEMTFLDNAGVSHSIQSSASQSVTVNFTPALTIPATPTVLNVDLNVANSISSDASGNITGFNFTPASFNITTQPVAAQNQQDDDNGEIEDVTGLVTSTSGSSFTMKVGQTGAQLTFTTDSSTQFSDGLTTVASTLNQIVKVEGSTKSDGTLFASEVEGIEDQNGNELEGVITTVTGNPATALTILAQDGTGNGVTAANVGAAFPVDVSGVQASAYRVNQGGVDFSGLGPVGGNSLNFPFGPGSIFPGQRIEVESVNALPASGSVVAEKLKLQQQTLTVTVTGITSNSVPTTLAVTLPSDSYLALLAGGTVNLTVWQQAGTNVRTPGKTIHVGDTIRVRGLLFCSHGPIPSLTGCNLIARRITP